MLKIIVIFMGFQWERVSQGKIPIGLDDSDTDFNTIGKTGGEKEVTLTADEVPAHNHTFWKGDNVSGSGNRVMTGIWWNGSRRCRYI